MHAIAFAERGLAVTVQKGLSILAALFYRLGIQRGKAVQSLAVELASALSLSLR